MSITIDGFTTIRELGTGATGSVYLASHPNFPNNVALKVLVNDGQASYQRLHKNMKIEIDALRALNHPHIMRICGAAIDTQWNENGQVKTGDYIASEVLCNGELFDFIDHPRGAIPEEVAKVLFKQMLSGLTYMHSKGLANRDLKLENMLIGDDFQVRIADFGFAAKMEGHNADGQITSFLGTPGYMAPEILEGRNYTGQGVDMYALGVVLFAMCTKSTPFQPISNVPRNQSLLAVDQLF